MESKNVFGLAAFVALMLGPVSHAVGQVARSPDSGPATASTLADLAEIQLRRLTYEALTGMNEAKLAYEKTSRVEDRSATGVPTVRSVQGVGGELSAILVYAGGAQATARAGEDIPGGYRVKSISVDRVVLTRNGQDLRLGFSAEAPQSVTEGPVRLTSPFPGAAVPFQPGR